MVSQSATSNVARRGTLPAYIELSLAMGIVGSSVVAGKFVVAAFPVFFASELRFVISSAILVPLLLTREKNAILSLARRDLLVMFFQGLTGVFLFNVFFLYGLEFTTGISAGIITSTTPAVIGILSFVFLREKIAAAEGAGILLAVLGVLVINVMGSSTGSSQGPNPLLGNLLIFGAVVGEALFTILRKATSSSVSPLATSTMMSVFGLLMFLPFSLFQAQWPSLSSDTSGWLSIVYYGVFVTVFAFVLWFRGLSKVRASTAGVFTGVLPVSSVILSVLILGETFLPFDLLGIVCVVLGIGLIAWNPRRNRKAY